MLGGAVPVRPAGSVTLPPPMNALTVSGFVRVMVSVEFTPGATLVGAKATVMLGINEAAAMLIDTFCVALGNVPLAACTRNPVGPAVVGAPLNTPVAGLSVRPAGNVPVAMLQVIGVVPEAVKVKV